MSLSTLITFTLSLVIYVFYHLKLLVVLTVNTKSVKRVDNYTNNTYISRYYQYNLTPVYSSNFSSHVHIEVIRFPLFLFNRC